MIAASFFNATNVDESTVRLLIDDVDVSGKMMLEDGILSYDPDKMETGNHTIEIQMKDLDQQDLSPVQWSFTFGTIQQNITKIIDFSGSANSRISTETVAGTPLNIAEITGKFSLGCSMGKIDNGHTIDFQGISISSTTKPIGYPIFFWANFGFGYW